MPAFISASAPRMAGSVLDRIRHDGLPVQPSLWWTLFDRSSEALAADTVQSRRHAGPIRVEDDGSIVGRQDDDETDMSLLTGDVRSNKTRSHHRSVAC